MAGLSKGVKIAAIFAAIGIAVGIGASLALTRNNEIQQRIAEDGDAFDELSLAEKTKLLSYLTVGINYKHRLTVGEEGIFIGNAKGGSPPYQYEWKFSDGTTYTTQNMTRSFDSPGTYEGRFTATDSAGDSRYSSFTIQAVESMPESANSTQDADR
jgi:hypothetical protein